MGGEDVRELVEAQARARIADDLAAFASYMTPQAVLQLGGNGAGPRPLPRPRRFDVLDITPQGDAIGGDQRRLGAEHPAEAEPEVHRHTDHQRDQTQHHSESFDDHDDRYPWGDRPIPGCDETAPLSAARRDRRVRKSPPFRQRRTCRGGCGRC